MPAISPHCIGALIARRDGAADPHRTLQAFRRGAEAAGVTIREGVGVDAIEPAGSDWRVRTVAGDFVAPTVINAAGAWAGKIAAMLGDEMIDEASRKMALRLAERGRAAGLTPARSQRLDRLRTALAKLGAPE